MSTFKTSSTLKPLPLLQYSHHPQHICIVIMCPIAALVNGGNIKNVMEKKGRGKFLLFLFLHTSNFWMQRWPVRVYCTVYCTVLYCTVLYCTVLYCTVLYCTVLYCKKKKKKKKKSHPPPKKNSPPPKKSPPPQKKKIPPPSKKNPPPPKKNIPPKINHPPKIILNYTFKKTVLYCGPWVLCWVCALVF